MTPPENSQSRKHAELTISMHRRHVKGQICFYTAEMILLRIKYKGNPLSHYLQINNKVPKNKPNQGCGKAL